MNSRVVEDSNGDIHSIAWDELPLEATEGFLTDFEFASLPGGSQHVDPSAEHNLKDGMTVSSVIVSLSTNLT